MAVADPSDDQFTLGAIKVRLDSSDWQQEILPHLRSANLIVFVPGYTSGIQWELEQIQALGMLERVVLVFPPTEPIDRAARWDVARELLKSTGVLNLPTNIPERTLCIRVVADGVKVTEAEGCSERDYKVALGTTLLD